MNFVNNKGLAVIAGLGRRLAPLAAVFAIIWPVGVFAAAGDVWIEPSVTQAAQDQDFSANVYVDTGASKLGAYQMVITFDPAQIQTTRQGGGVAVKPGADGFVMAARVDNKGGIIVVNGLNVTGKGPGSRLEILDIAFKGVGKDAPGKMQVAVEALTDETGRAIGK